MSDKKLILPGVNSSGGSGHQAAYIKHWRSQLQNALRFANLTAEVRSNLGAFIDKETHRVFVEKKWNPQDRLDYWWARQMTPQTIAANAQSQMIRLQEQAEIDMHVANIVKKAMPQDYCLDASDIRLIDEQYHQIKYISEIWLFDQWAIGFLKDHLIRKQRAVAKTEQSMIEAKNESVRKSLPKTRYD